MSLIIAVKSCQAHQPYHQAIRDTWGPTVHAPVLFFMGGNTNRVFEDEHVVPSPDDYMSLPTKTQQILRWLVRNETFDHVYLCDNDTFVRSSRFANLEYPKYDYSGHMNKLCDVGKTAFYRDHIAVFNECHPWASGHRVLPVAPRSEADRVPGAERMGRGSMGRPGHGAADPGKENVRIAPGKLQRARRVALQKNQEVSAVQS